MGCLDAVELLVIRFMQFSASHLDYSNMENAKLDELPVHLRFSHPVWCHHFFRTFVFRSCKTTHRKNECNMIVSSQANHQRLTIGTSIGALSKSAASETLLHKKLDKIDKNLALVVMNTSNNNARNVNESLQTSPSGDSNQIEVRNQSVKTIKKSRFVHFSNEIRHGNEHLHHMSRGLTTVRELWIEYTMGTNGGGQH